MFKSIIATVAVIVAFAAPVQAETPTFDLSGVQTSAMYFDSVMLIAERNSQDALAEATRNIQIVDANLNTTANQVETNTRDIAILAGNGAQILAPAVDTNTADVSDLFGLYNMQSASIFRNNSAAEEARNELAEKIAIRYQAQQAQLSDAEDRIANLEVTLQNLIDMFSNQ